MKKLNKKGFTLVEMLVVIAIIAVLVAIIIPTTSSATTKAKAATDAANLRAITAEATIDYLEDGEMTNSYTMESKLLGKSGLTVSFVENAGALTAYFVDGSNYYTVASLTTAAETGKDTSVALSAAPAGTAPKAASSGSGTQTEQGSGTQTEQN